MQNKRARALVSARGGGARRVGDGDSASSTSARCVRVRVQLLACRRSLALNRAELVFLAMLTVSDYTRGVPHVGATTARLLIRRFLRPRIRARALRRLLRRVQLRCRGHSRPAAGPACRATRRSRPAPSATSETGSLRHTS